MRDVVFNLPPTDQVEIQGEYSLPVIALSILIAIVASFTALSMNKRAKRNSFFHQKFWVGLGAVAMGFGIWSMHIVGIAGFSLPVEMYYDPLLTVVSIVPAMLASYLAFHVANRQKKSLWVSLVAGVCMGLGLSTMYYVGMLAMKMDVSIIYDGKLFIASIIVAIVACFIVLLVFTSLNHFTGNYLIQGMTAIVMGLAVSSMHYISMFSITYYAPIDYAYTETTTHSTGNNIIIISVTVGIALLLSSLSFSSIIDRYIRYRTNYYDSLTILPNRRKFERELGKSSTHQTLAIWHVHNLEKINRENGYLFGDKVIQYFSSLMMSLSPSRTQFYRIEGNRFAFLKRSQEGDEDFRDAMGKMAEILKSPIVIENEKFILPAVCAWQSASIERDVLKVYTNVLAVLNYPSIQYEHEVIPYNPNIHTYTFEREISSDVERAMNGLELHLVFQPKINGITYQITGVETLLRWDHPFYGMLSPGMFIPILERDGQMLDVTDWVIEKACLQISEWRKKEVSFGQVAINIPGQYVTSSRLLQVLKKTLSKYNLESKMIELEITETSFVKNIEEAMRAVSILRQEGFSVALDDFGTGVSSLSYLKRMPISTLKIDKSFVDEVPFSEKDSSIIQAIIALGNSLNLSIVFEGVETKEQARFLSSICKQPIIQGYYFAKPMASQDLIEWRHAFQQTQIPVL